MTQIKNILLIAAAVVIIILLLRYCKGGSGKIIETVRIDTAWIPVKQDTHYIPKPYVVYLPGNAPKAFEKWDTLYIPELVDTAAILQDYHSFYIYNDEIAHKYGRTFITDTVSRNKILGRSVSHDLLLPSITKTITLEKPPRNQVYIGGGLLGNEKDLAAGYEVNLSLKTKNDRIIEVGYDRLFNGAGYFKIGYRHKISFRK